jgi:hypothetical protein
MNRSRTQIATSYAPGALFTYEGGMGCCVAIPKNTPYEASTLGVQRQLFELLGEFVQNWHDRAMACRQTPQVLPEQCLDAAFLDHKNEPKIDSGRFLLNRPSRIGFMPDPLVFVCSECQRLVEFQDVIELDRRWSSEESRRDCRASESGRHSWRQMDVVFAHWSGSYAGLSPGRVVMDSNGRIDTLRTCPNCGNEEYQLVTNSSPFFSDWRFQCTNCLSGKEIVQADRETLALLKPRMDAGMGNLPKEWNMLPVSYRASSVYYVQRDSFIVFKHADVALLLGAGRRAELVKALMKLYEFSGGELTNDEVLRQLTANGRAAEAKTYEDLAELLSFLPPVKRAVIESQLTSLQSQYQQEGFVSVQRKESPKLVTQVEDSQDWVRRYNPIRLALEHASLRSEIIDREGSDPSLPSVSVTNPDVLDIEQDDLSERQLYSSRVEDSLDRLGLAEMVLIRGLDICEFSFGYSRVSSTPWTTIKDREMPVRLKAFDHVEANKRPVYVLEQKNEGIYVRLNEARVRRWLERNGLPVIDDEAPARIGGTYLLDYLDFGRFLVNYKEGTSGPKTQRSIPNYTYLLLHTMTHHLTQVLIEYSGLEHGSLGEYIFPADLAFLVYRRGMTPDLGNLSAMWRNYGVTILEDLLSDRSLRCDAGSLCDQRGGACPACIMAPEIACVTGNNLLCRAALNGGPAPGWDLVRDELVGYLRS